MKSVEINDLLSYHFYGNLKVKDGVKVFVDGVAAEKTLPTAFAFS